MLDHVAEATVVIMPVTVLGELEAGFKLGRRTQENRHALDDFLDEPFVSVLAVTAVTVRHYARIFSTLRRAGTPIPTNDVWIAASTMECGGCLITFDRHYRHIVELDHTILDTSAAP